MLGSRLSNCNPLIFRTTEVQVFEYVRYPDTEIIVSPTLLVIVGIAICLSMFQENQHHVFNYGIGAVHNPHTTSNKFRIDSLSFAVTEHCI